jgi:type VI secretion system protein ImpA
MLDLARLLAPTTDAPPCGNNYEYDPPFKDIEKAATRVLPKEFGEHRTPGQEPNWPQVLELSKGLLERSKDARIAIYLARALLHTEGAVGIGEALTLIHELTAQYWDHLHPQLEDGGDATMRVNALTALQDAEGLLPDLRNAFVVNSREHGQLRVRDIEVALGRLPPREGATALSIEQVRAQLAAAIASGNPIPQALAQAIEAIQAMRNLLGERVTIGSVPDFKALTDILLPLKKVCDDAVPQPTNPDPEVPHTEHGVSPAVTLPAANGPIRSRADALRVLDGVCAYLEHNEPSNPAPLFIRRAQRLMSKSFVEIVEDLLPDSISNLEHLAGKLDSAAH